jgi:hypothetical protein
MSDPHDPTSATDTGTEGPGAPADAGTEGPSGPADAGTEGPGGPADAGTEGPGAGPAGAPSEEELRAAYEAELARITAVDMIAQSAVSLLNIGARRMGPPPGREGEAGAPQRDLEQVRDAIDGARALLAILERRIGAQELAPLKDALSRLQMAYAQEVGGSGTPGGEPPQGGQEPPGGATPKPGEEQQPGTPGPGPAESSGRLWVPGQ